MTDQRPAVTFIDIVPVNVHGRGIPGTPVVEHGKSVVRTRIVAVDLPNRKARTDNAEIVDFDNIWVRDLDLLFRSTPS